MGNEAAKLAAPEDAERYRSALSGVGDVNADPARAFALDGPATRSGVLTPLRGEGEQRLHGNAAACEELLAEMWRRRSAVEHALRVASELYAEAEAAAMQTYAHAQHGAGGAPSAWWKEQGPQQRATLTASQREEVIARLLSERAALAEADLLVYARHSAAWSDFIALNPLAAVAAAQLVQQDRPQSHSPGSIAPGATASSPDPASTQQAIRDGRRYLYSSPLRPLVGRGPSPQADSPLGAGAGNPQELASVREELLRTRRRCVELARAEREAREELQALVASHANVEAASADMRPELLAAEAGLASAAAAVAGVITQAAAEREAMMARVTAMRNQLTMFREATEQLRWDASAATESVAGDKARLLERCAAIEAATQTVLSSAVRLDPDVALSEEDEAVDTTDAMERVAAAESAAAAAAVAQRAMEVTAMHAAEAARASAAERAVLAQANVALQAQLEEVRRSLRKLPPLEAARAPLAAPSIASAPRSEVDWMSDAGGFSESGSAFGDGADLAALRVRRERQREDARARALQNRAKFEAIKAERNALKAESRRSGAELAALRSEAARVGELQAQLRTIQSSLFL